MKKLREMDFFESIIYDQDNTLVSDAVQEGRIPIGYNCYMTPRPLLSSGKAFPVRLRATGVINTEIADFYMSTVLCSYMRALLEASFSGEYRLLNAIVFSSSCQHCNKCNHNMSAVGIDTDKEGVLICTIDSPQKNSAPFVKLYADSMRKTADELSTRFGIDMSDDAIRRAIKEHNEFNRKLRKLSDLRKTPNPKITGVEFQTVMSASQIAPRDMMTQQLDRLIAAAKERKGSKPKVRLMVVGAVIDSPEYIQLIEDVGAAVVADRFCFGSLPGMEPIDETGDPYISMATHYLSTCECPRMVENWRGRIDSIVKWAQEFNVDGVVIESIKFCDWWGYEVLTMINSLEQHGIPVVKIEREYSYANEGQFRTRIQAFIESLEHKDKQISTMGGSLHEDV